MSNTPPTMSHTKAQRKWWHQGKNGFFWVANNSTPRRHKRRLVYKSDAISRLRPGYVVPDRKRGKTWL